MISRLLKGLLKADKNVVVLMVGTIVSQAIPILATLVLTRLYSPEDFGLFQVYFSLSIVLSVIVTLRYEMAIMLPKSDEDARHVMVLSCLISFGISVLVAIIVFFFGDCFTQVLEQPPLKQSLWILPFTLLVIGIYQSFNYWSNRKKHYKRLAYSRVNRSIGTSVLSIVLGFFQSMKTVGLNLGDALGQAFAALFLGARIYRDDKKIFGSISKVKLKEMAKRYRQFPFFNVPSGIFEKMSSHMPSLLLVPFYGINVVGWFGLSQRLISLPGGIIARAFGDVFRQSAAEMLHEGNNCRPLFISTFKKLSAMSVPFFIILFFTVKPLFAFFFGDEWIVAGEYAQILLPMYLLQFIVSPLSSMFLVAEKQKQEFFVQIFLMLGVLSALCLSYLWFNTPKASIAAYCIVYSLKYLVELKMSYGYSKGN